MEERRQAATFSPDQEDDFWQELWPEPPQPFDIATHLGTTRAYRWPGDDARSPVVFLHGSGGTARVVGT